nr:uncharacterized protein LOC117988468 [Maniola hyperantus]
MAQGKMKVKSKLPSGAKSKVNKAKGKAVTKRINAPVKSKAKAQVVERNKMKAKVTKMVNAAAEKQLRALATDTPQLSEAQMRVASAPTAPTPAK